MAFCLLQKIHIEAARINDENESLQIQVVKSEKHQPRHFLPLKTQTRFTRDVIVINCRTTACISTQHRRCQTTRATEIIIICKARAHAKSNKVQAPASTL